MHAPINDSLISMHIWSALWTIMDTVGLTKHLKLGEKSVCVCGGGRVGKEGMAEGIWSDYVICMDETFN